MIWLVLQCPCSESQNRAFPQRGQISRVKGPGPRTEIALLIRIDPNHTVLKGGHLMSAAENKAISLLREQVQTAHNLLEGTVGDVTPEEAHWSPPGRAHPLGANYAHVVISEDATMNGLLKGGESLFTSSWSGKVGVSELPPMPNPNAPGFPDWSEWGRRVKLTWQPCENTHRHSTLPRTSIWLHWLIVT